MLLEINDPWERSLYDIVFPTDKMTPAEIADNIRENVEKSVVRPTGRSKNAVDDFLLASRVEAELAKEGHDIGVKARSGNVSLTIDKHVLMLSRLENELKSIAEQVKGVTAVETKVGPGYYQADIYRRQDFEVPSKILLVDDEREFVQTLSERLMMRDLGSAVAYDGESALEVAREDEPDVMILDLKMPGIDGIEVLRRIKKTQPEIEVIILTGHGSEADKTICKQLGAFAYLQKPVDIEELSATIKAAHEQIRRKQNA
jgi:CheY-like chemotaxis protein